jgi:hypothetical protein
MKYVSVGIELFLHCIDYKKELSMNHVPNTVIKLVDFMRTEVCTTGTSCPS